MTRLLAAHTMTTPLEAPLPGVPSEGTLVAYQRRVVRAAVERVGIDHRVTKGVPPTEGPERMGGQASAGQTGVRSVAPEEDQTATASGGARC